MIQISSGFSSWSGAGLDNSSVRHLPYMHRILGENEYPIVERQTELCGARGGFG
jgi:hypothetical protein